MSLYTSIYFHPKSPRFYPTEAQVREIMAKLRIQTVEIACGEPRPPLLEVLRRKFFPRIIETYPITPDLFWETNVSLDRALELWREHKPYSTGFSLKHEGLAEELTSVIRERIPADLARDFLPWDTGIKLGPWEHHDYNTGEVTAKGRFAVSKSANGCPRDLGKYHFAFASIPEIRDLLAAFEATTETPWTSSIELT
jgi:hypothetical protein